MKKTYENLQLLRYLAAVGVVLFHTTGAYISTHSSNTVNGFSWGAKGVDLFFVISGFVIATSYLNNPRPPIQFAINRISRIAPSYWLLTLAALFVGLFISVGGAPKVNQGQLVLWRVASFTFTAHAVGFPNPVLYQGWSLEYEMFFYAIFALALYSGLKGKSLLVIVGLIVFLATIIPNFSITAIGFVIGLVLAAIHHEISPGATAQWSALAGLTICTVLLSSARLEDSQVKEFAWLCAFGCLVFLAVRLPKLRGNWVLRLGSASYPIYLLQWFTIPALSKAEARFSTLSQGESYVVLMCCSIVVTTTAGLLWDRYVDKHISFWTKGQLSTRFERSLT